MKKFSKGLFFLLISISMDINAQEIYGDWIKTKVTYTDNVELSNDNALKYQYLRYTFEKYNKLFIGVIYDDKGTSFIFDINSNIINIKNPNGFLINSFLIKRITDDELVLIQKGKTSFTDFDCIEFSFVKEEIYQKSILLKSSDILLTSRIDTIYKSSEKIYAKFSGDKSFFDFCHEYLPEVNGSGYFLSAFIIRKNGIIDSIHILENINKRFEKQFRKALDKSKAFWIPGELDGQKIDVQMKVEYKYFTSEQMIPKYDYSQKGKQAMKNLDYSRALTYFELALEKVPSDYEIIYYKAICELNLGNKKAACEDLQKVKTIGKVNIDELVKQCCE